MGHVVGFTPDPSEPGLDTTIFSIYEPSQMEQNGHISCPKYVGHTLTDLYAITLSSVLNIPTSNNISYITTSFMGMIVPTASVTCSCV
jgi:hypothetical protein